MTGGRAALDYAEQQLGVHTVYEEAQRLGTELDKHRNSLANVKRDRYRVEEAIADREIEVASDLRAIMPEASLAAFERQLKSVVRTDVKLRDLRDQLLDVNYSISYLEVEVSTTKVSTDIAVARMTELGGYFQYLAAIKQAETAAKFSDVLKGTDWPPDPS